MPTCAGVLRSRCRASWRSPITATFSRRPGGAGKELNRGGIDVNKKWGIAAGMAITLIAVGALLLFVLRPGWIPASLVFGKTVTPGPRTAPAATATPTPLPVSPSPQAQGPIALVWWTPEWFSPLAANAGGQALADSIARFEKAYPSIVIKPVLKSAYGPTGILSYLQASQKVAPGVLPDVVSLDYRDVAAAAGDKLLRPLNREKLPAAKTFYPFAQSAWHIGGDAYLLPYTADVEQMTYDGNRVSSPPRTWADLLNGNWHYLLPTAGREGEANVAFLIQYIAAGGSLDANDGRIATQALRRTLDFYQHALGKGVFPQAVLSFATPEDAWQPFLQGDAELVEMRASRFLRQRQMNVDLRFAPVPTANGDVVTVARGWGLGIVTALPQRQEAALAFMNWLANEKEMAKWSFAAQQLPTRPAALQLWPQRDSYDAFLAQLLQAAALEPVTLGQRATARLLQQALLAVLSGKATPAEAAAQAKKGQ